MKLGKRLAMLMAGLLLVPGVMRAQQQTSPVLVTQEKANSPNLPAMTHLRVDLVLTEYSGEKKISSLPYTMYVGVRDQGHSAGKQSLRMGVNVLILGDGSESVGTNIDCWASAEEDGRYRIEGNVDRSSIYSVDQNGNAGDEGRATGVRPIVRHFSSGFDLVLHDGETGEVVSATDPFNGHVLKVVVTIHVVK